MPARNSEPTLHDIGQEFPGRACLPSQRPFGGCPAIRMQDPDHPVSEQYAQIQADNPAELPQRIVAAEAALTRARTRATVTTASTAHTAPRPERSTARHAAPERLPRWRPLITTDQPACRPPAPPWWQPHAEELPHWHAWRGGSGRLYAHKLATLPPVVVRADNPAGLREQIRQAEAR